MATDEKKPDCTLSDGTAVTFDKRKIKPREWRALFDPQQSEEEGEEIMARFACLDVEYYRELSVYDTQLIYAAAAEAIRKPVDPSLVNTSTKPS